MKATAGTSHPRTTHTGVRRSWRATRGAVMVEYAFLLAFVFIPLSIGIVEGGKILIKNYRLTRGWVLKNSP
jgi:Flp pilus assembly protein TadG